MSGYRPRNRGNKTTARHGSSIARRLRQAGINVSPAVRRHEHDGIFVAARAEFVSVLVDLGDAEEVRRSAREIMQLVTDWGFCPVLSERTHDDGRTRATVLFDCD